jgi:flagellar assembly protein FliH
MTQQANPGAVLQRVAVQGFVAPVRPGKAQAQELSPRDTVAEALRQGHAQGMRAGRDEGLAAGYEAGLQEGRAAGQAEIGAAAQAAALQAGRALAQREQQLLATITSLQERTGELLAGAQEEMVLLCYEVICRVLGEAALRRDLVQAQVDAALAQWRGQRPLTVLLHADDALLLEATAVPGDIHWQADAGVGLGGCILRGPEGALDARLEHVLEDVKGALLAARGAAANSPASTEAGP